MVAVMAVVPGCCAVMTLVVALMVATEEVPTLKESVPMDEPQLGTGRQGGELRPPFLEQSAVPLESKAVVGGVTAPPPPEVMESSVPARDRVWSEVKLTVAVAPTEPLLKLDQIAILPHRSIDRSQIE